MSLRFLKIFAGVLLLTACEKQADLTPLTITTDSGEVTYQVESAVTREEMAHGLMERKSLAADSGMIFNIGGERHVAMWMQDTYIPLDMIYVGTDGRISWIYENAEPLSTKLIQPQEQEPVLAVIELNAGDVKKHGIKVGDKVKHQLIN